MFKLVENTQCSSLSTAREGKARANKSAGRCADLKRKETSACRRALVDDQIENITRTNTQNRVVFAVQEKNCCETVENSRIVSSRPGRDGLLFTSR